MTLPSDQRDPVCSCIENCLSEFGKESSDQLKKRTEGGEIYLHFDGYSSRAINYDVALIRLAMAMLNDQRYGATMRQALDSQMNW